MEKAGKNIRKSALTVAPPYVDSIESLRDEPEPIADVLMSVRQRSLRCGNVSDRKSV
jgi:hypothetical protein